MPEPPCWGLIEEHSLGPVTEEHTVLPAPAEEHAVHSAPTAGDAAHQGWRLAIEEHTGWASNTAPSPHGTHLLRVVQSVQGKGKQGHCSRAGL